VPKYLTAKCPKCPGKRTIVRQVPDGTIHVELERSGRYTAVCGTCGENLEGPLTDLELTETKTAIPKPKGRA